MTAVQTLMERRANVWSQMVEIEARPKDPTSGLTTAEDAAAYDKAEADYENLDKEIARAEAHALREANNAKVDRTGVVGGDTIEHESAQDAAYAQAFTNYLVYGAADLPADQRNILQTGFVSNLLGDKNPRGAAGVGTGAAGGYTVPPAFRNALIEQMTYVAAMRQYAEVIRTDSGANMPWPTADDTAQEGVILAENTAAAEQDVTFGTNSLDAYMYTSKLVRVSIQLLQDSGFNLEGWLAGALGRRIGRIQNRHYTIGTGTAQPDGLFVSATVGKTGTTGQTTTIIYDDLVDLVESIDPAYIEQGGENVGFMGSQAIRKVVRKLKDSQNRPLWEPSIQAGVPNYLMGYPFRINNYVPTPAANAKSLGFGNIREAYVIRDVSDVQLMRLTERFAEYLQVAFMAYQRSDGTLQNASAFKLYQNSAT